MLQYKLDNEFELVFVAGYQKILKLSYVDKFLDDIHREIRDRFRSKLADKRFHAAGLAIDELYAEVLEKAEVWGFQIANQPKTMRTFDESRKSKKTVDSMITRSGDNQDKKKSKKGDGSNKKLCQGDVNENQENELAEVEMTEDDKGNVGEGDAGQENEENDFELPKIIPKGIQRKPGPGKFAV